MAADIVLRDTLSAAPAKDFHQRLLLQGGRHVPVFASASGAAIRWQRRATPGSIGTWGKLFHPAPGHHGYRQMVAVRTIAIPLGFARVVHLVGKFCTLMDDTILRDNKMITQILRSQFFYGATNIWASCVVNGHAFWRATVKRSQSYKPASVLLSCFGEGIGKVQSILIWYRTRKHPTTLKQALWGKVLRRS